MKKSPMTRNASRWPRAACRSRTAALAFALAAAAGAHAELTLGLQAEYSRDGGPSIGAAAQAIAELYGPVFAARLSGSGQAGAALSPIAFDGELEARAELSASLGSFAAILDLRGAAESHPALGASPAAEAGAELSFVANGESVSATLRPRCDWSSGADGYFELGAAIGASIGAGQLVLKPEADLSWTQWADGGESLTALPRLGLSWYPGFPVSLSMEAGFRRSWLEDSSALDQIPAGASVFAAIGARILLRARASALFGVSVPGLDEVELSAASSLVLGEALGGEIRLPLDLSWSSDDATGFSAALGLELALFP